MAASSHREREHGNALRPLGRIAPRIALRVTIDSFFGAMVGSIDRSKFRGADLAGYDKIAVQRIASSCVTYFQTCQESWHPNANGQEVLGRCLAGAATTTARTVTCVRSANGTITVG